MKKVNSTIDKVQKGY